MAKLSFKDYSEWLKDNWLKVGMMVGLYFTLATLMFSSKLDTLGILLFLAMPLYVIHEMEEYILPGGFVDFFNRDIFKVNPANKIQPIDREVIFWINAFYVYIFLPLGAGLYMIDPILGAWVPYYFLFHAIGHPVLSIKGRRKYNGGMLTGLLIFIPYGIWTISIFLKQGVITCPYWNWPMAVGISINLLLPFMVFCPLPFGIIKRYRKRISEQN